MVTYVSWTPNNNCSYLLIRYELNCRGRATLFIQIRENKENKVIIVLCLLTFEFSILGFHVIFITRQFCNYSLFVVLVIVASKSLHFVKLLSHSNQAMLVKIQVKFSYSQLFHFATFNEGVPSKVLIRSFVLLPPPLLSCSCSNVLSDINILQMINICNNMLLIDIIFCGEALDGISIVYNTVRMFIIQVFKRDRSDRVIGR